jgi:acyl-CoA thioesterase
VTSSDDDSFKRIAALFERDRFARENGMRVMEVRLGYARAEMMVEPRHMNSIGILQGGAVFTLADLAFAGASNSHGVVAVGSQADITYFKAVRAGKLTAVAEEICRTHKLSTCLIRVTDEENNLVALFKGLAFVKGTPLLDAP